MGVLKVCLPAPMLAKALPERWVVQPSATMMTAPLGKVEREISLPRGYSLSTRAEGAALVVIVAGPDGADAASGRLIRSGGHAVFDRIETDAAHRRLGLGRGVMAALTVVALERGVNAGVLVATSAGRWLYEAIGWDKHAAYTTAVIPGLESPPAAPRASRASHLNQG